MAREAHPESYYAATAVGVTDYPEFASGLTCDVCVVGGGFTGLSPALAEQAASLQ